ncbi:MAG: beta-galactosidase trimerization domain-containing protein [Clostridia bacterium]
MQDVRFRQVHLDFHTSGQIPGIGAQFDAEDFASTLEKAHVNSITCFARCHHGWLYYDSKNMPERMHPNLANKNLLKEQIEACHRHGIKVPVYTTVQWDDEIAREHYDWLVLNEQGAPFNQPPFKAGFYRNLCLNSGYVDYLKAQVRDMFESLGELDGLFFDILNIKPCCCPNCLRDIQKLGLDGSDETVRYVFAQQVFDFFMRDMTRMIHEIQPGCPVFYNAGFIGTRHRADIDAFTHLEIESLPGGSWGYNHFPVTARYARTLGRTFVGMTGKFHTDWGDFGSFRNEAALEYECFKALAYGGRCSIGDQLHPSGAISQATYHLIGKVYEQVAQKEMWVQGAVPVVEAAVLIPEEFKRPGTLLVSPELTGAAKLLTHMSVQFDVVDSKACFSDYRLLVLPDDIPVEGALSEKITAFLEKGGVLIASHRSGLDAAGGAFAPFMPVDAQGDAPFSPDFAVGDGPIMAGLEPNTEYVMYDKGMKVAVRPGASELVKANVPYFNRTWQHFCSHQHTPSAEKYGYPAVVGNARVIYFAHPVFRTYDQYGCRWIRTMVGNAVRNLLKGTLLTHDGPSTLELTLSEQVAQGRLVLHALHYIPERRAERMDILEDVIALYQVRVTAMTARKVRAILTAPEAQVLAFEEVPGGVTFVIPEIRGHQMVEMRY